MPPPSVAAEPPPGWIATDVTPPTLGGGSGAVLTQWSALASPSSGDVLLLACVATPIPGWVEDMRPSVEARTLSLASSSAERIVGKDLETRKEPDHLALRRAGADDAAAPVGITRTFIGWSPHDVMTCFATCATPHAKEHRDVRACDASVTSARLEGASAPPRPGVLLGGVTWAVHHPSSTVLWGGLVVFFVGALAVVCRRRPRSRI